MRILVFSASTGGGHKRAAAALKEYIEANSDNAEVKITDGLALGGKGYNKLVCDGYTTLAKFAPKFYGRLYINSDKKSKLNDLCNGVNQRKGKHLYPEIAAYKPDVIISCHAFTTTMLGELKTKGVIDIPVISLVTDFAPHYTYIAEGIDHYIVSSEKMVATFKTRFNINSSHVHAFGIPTFDKFAKTPDKNELKEKLGLKPDTKVILFMAGSWGVTEVLDIYKDIADKTENCQFVVITGNNQKLYDKFEKVKDNRTILKKFVDNVEDYMHCSDLIITKPGGLTVSESLQCGLPMAIYSAYPGQEAENAEYLVESGVALLLNKHPGETVSALINYDSKLKEMSDCCRKACRGNASEQIFELINEILSK
ncbi:MAG: CDP-glycerol glycerophosphotransferase family protein [Ruminococcus sp.]|nr:CDP-glycerol glycerophosphotransferase family protein [Ruminococcus sp.]